MTGEEIVRQIRDAIKGFQLTSRKFAQVMTAELMKKVLADEGIPRSARDVFIRGISLEIDLIVPHRDPKELSSASQARGRLCIRSLLRSAGDIVTQHPNRTSAFRVSPLAPDYGWTPKRQRTGIVS